MPDATPPTSPVTATVKLEATAVQPRRAQRGRPSTKHPQEPGIPKPWACKWRDCQKSFSRKSDLVRHDHTHTGTRNHVCLHPNCGKTFIQTSALTVHKRTHTGEKPHECGVCKKCFADSSSLARHRRTHSSDHKPTKCSEPGCSKTFIRESTLKEHVERRHNQHTHLHGNVNNDQGLKTERQSPVIKSDPVAGTRRASFANPGPRNTASSFQPGLSASIGMSVSDDGYFTTQPSTPTLSSWQLTANPQPYPAMKQSFRVHRPSVPLSLHTIQNCYEPGPLSAPVYSGQHFTSPFVNIYPSPMYNGDIHGHSPMTSSPICQTLMSPNHPLAHQYSLAPTGDIVSAPAPEPQLYTASVKVETPHQDMFDPMEAQYQEPQDLGAAPLGQYYQLPRFSLGFPDTDEDKLISDFGEPLPSQII